MPYTIKQVAEQTQLTPYTLRYYEKEGILPPVTRDLAGNRLYTDEDLEWLSVICCLKNTGMPVKEIQSFVELCMQGDETIQIRREIVLHHRANLEQKISRLMAELKKVNEKVDYYTQACADGTERYVKEACHKKNAG